MTGIGFKLSNGRSALHVWRSPAATRESARVLPNSSHLKWTDAHGPADLLKALKDGGAEVVVMTLEDILSNGYQAVPPAAKAAGAWALILVPEPHPAMELVGEKRYLLRAASLTGALRDIMRNVLAGIAG